MEVFLVANKVRRPSGGPGKCWLWFFWGAGGPGVTQAFIVAGRLKETRTPWPEGCPSLSCRPTMARKPGRRCTYHRPPTRDPKAAHSAPYQWAWPGPCRCRGTMSIKILPRRRIRRNEASLCGVLSAHSTGEPRLYPPQRAERCLQPLSSSWPGTEVWQMKGEKRNAGYFRAAERC